MTLKKSINFVKHRILIEYNFRLSQKDLCHLAFDDELFWLIISFDWWSPSTLIIKQLASWCGLDHTCYTHAFIHIQLPLLANNAYQCGRQCQRIRKRGAIHATARWTIVRQSEWEKLIPSLPSRLTDLMYRTDRKIVPCNKFEDAAKLRHTPTIHREKKMSVCQTANRATKVSSARSNGGNKPELDHLIYGCDTLIMI